MSFGGIGFESFYRNYWFDLGPGTVPVQVLTGNPYRRILRLLSAGGGSPQFLPAAWTLNTFLLSTDVTFQPSSGAGFIELRYIDWGPLVTDAWFCVGVTALGTVCGVIEAGWAPSGG